MKKKKNKNKNKAMEGTLLVYNRSSPPISDFFFKLYFSSKRAKLCVSWASLMAA